MKAFLLILVAVIIVALVITGLMFGSVYNGLVSKEEGVSGAWAQVENVYQRRADLVPNLVETVKGYAAHEKETLQSVIDARSRIGKIDTSSKIISSPDMLAKFQDAQTQLSSAIGRLLVVVERYPDLKASQNFLALQNQLEGTENRITVERRRFNEAAQDYNAFRRQFPNYVVANMAGFRNKAYFQADQDARTVPQVKF
ncbi:MAG TPA: LemA family protein [Candidatus Omnitrophota bacterium]|jgi:LemA protein|nr:MAG: LemA family protein [Candidatus Omnitrophica bacterium ADurb.Bin314]HQB93783.1 LemA family protein [Candidatus Omnitrophota bacterium]